MPEKLRRDLHDAAAMIQVALALVALIAWATTWPSSVVPDALAILGVTAYVVLRFGTPLTLGAMFDTPWWTRVSPMALLVVPVIALAILRHRIVGEAVGGITLLALIALTGPGAARAIKRRYFVPSAAP